MSHKINTVTELLMLALSGFNQVICVELDEINCNHRALLFKLVRYGNNMRHNLSTIHHLITNLTMLNQSINI